MQNAGLDEAQAGIKIARRNIINFRYAHDTTLMTESEEKLKSLLMKVSEESEKAGLKLSIQKMKIMASSHHFMANRWGNNGNSDKFYFLGSRITVDGDCSHEIKKKKPAPWKKTHDKHRQHIKKKGHHFTSKVPYRQSYGFSSNHVRM